MVGLTRGQSDSPACSGFPRFLQFTARDAGWGVVRHVPTSKESSNGDTCLLTRAQRRDLVFCPKLHARKFDTGSVPRCPSTSNPYRITADNNAIARLLHASIAKSALSAAFCVALAAHVAAHSSASLTGQPASPPLDLPCQPALPPPALPRQPRQPTSSPPPPPPPALPWQPHRSSAVCYPARLAFLAYTWHMPYILRPWTVLPREMLGLSILRRRSDAL